jgi:predicted DNA-binding protein
MRREKQFYARMATFTTTVELRDRLVKYSDDSQVPQAAIIRKAIEQYLDKVSTQAIQ